MGAPSHGVKAKLRWNRLHPQEYLPVCMDRTKSAFLKGAIDDWPKGSGILLATPSNVGCLSPESPNTKLKRKL